MEIREIDGRIAGALTRANQIDGELSGKHGHRLDGFIAAKRETFGEMDAGQTNFIHGDLASPLNSVSGELSSALRYSVTGVLDVPQGGTEVSVYKGEYNVSPTFDTQTLPTHGKKMRYDVTVDAVTYSLASTADINRMF